MSHKFIIVACDVSSANELVDLVKRIPASDCCVKIGKELFTSIGPQAVDICHTAGLNVFLDLKFHDIPTTCAKAVRAVARMGVWMTNIHCSGGYPMMAAAREVLEGESHQPMLIGVTVLTSMNQKDLTQIGVSKTIDSQVMNLAQLAKCAGLQGVVCSALETKHLSKEFGSEFCLVNPGIRPYWASNDEQQRVVTPKEALQNGAHHIVIGRPIIGSDEPEAVIARIISEEIML